MTTIHMMIMVILMILTILTILIIMGILIILMILTIAACSGEWGRGAGNCRHWAKPPRPADDALSSRSKLKNKETAFLSSSSFHHSCHHHHHHPNQQRPEHKVAKKQRTEGVVKLFSIRGPYKSPYTAPTHPPKKPHKGIHILCFKLQS